jgi:hypothetical protein
MLAVALSKPQLGILVLPGLLIAHQREYGLRKTCFFGMGLGLSILLLMLPLFLVYPGWIDDFLIAQSENPVWLHPSLFRLLPMWLGEIGRVLWVIMAIGITGLNFWLWWKRPANEVVQWSLALTPLVTPYIWSWDFVMSLPLLISTIFNFKSYAAQGLLLIGYVVSWGLMFQIDLSDNIDNYQYWWVPWVLIGLVSGGYLIDGDTV